MARAKLDRLLHVPAVIGAALASIAIAGAVSARTPAAGTRRGDAGRAQIPPTPSPPPIPTPSPTPSPIPTPTPSPTPSPPPVPTPTPSPTPTPQPAPFPTDAGGR